jgi:type I site-specific restriction endonuclease
MSRNDTPVTPGCEGEASRRPHLGEEPYCPSQSGTAFSIFTDTGPADYLLFINRIACGVIEAKKDSIGVKDSSLAMFLLTSF